MMKLSERIRKSMDDAVSGLSISWPIDQWADEVALLEAKLAAHLENEGDECPLCVLEDENETLKKRIKALEANTSKSVLRRIDAQLGVDDEN